VISFGISRFFGRGFVEGRGMTGRLDRYVEEHGVVLIFVLRLIPLVSFDAISYAAGSSGIRFRGFSRQPRSGCCQARSRSPISAGPRLASGGG
jgi:uncharacterized membrane protein YdjX (TVP38/TMEM64 family)